MTQERHQTVVIGSGFGGLAAARRLAKSDVDVTLIASTTHHLFQPLLYQVATGILSEGEIAPATRNILSRQKNARVLLGEVRAIDIERRLVVSEAGATRRATSYDSLIVAAGAGQSWFGNAHFAAHAPGMKSVDDALELRGRIFEAFELAELQAGRGEPVDHLLTFVIVGAGPTGVEMAGQIAELAHRTLRHDFRDIRTEATRILLLDAAPRVLPTMDSRLSAKAHRQLERVGVEVHLGCGVTHVDERGIEARGDDGTVWRIEARCKIWAAGVEASPLSRTLSAQTGVPLDRAGRVCVNADLTLPGHPEVFVVGDMMSLDDLPGVAQVAIQGGRHAAATISSRVCGRPAPTPFVYRDKGSMATVSRFQAVASVGSLRVSGPVAWFMWLGVHIAYLIGFKNRLTTVLHWSVSFLGRGRGQRTSTEQQISARAALAHLPCHLEPEPAPGR